MKKRQIINQGWLNFDMFSQYRSLAKNRNFLMLWFSQIFSQVTINILNFLILTRLFKLTGSTIATSMLWVAYALPAILIGPFGAVAVDIFSRKKLLILTNLLQAMVVFIFALSSENRLFLPFIIAFLYSLLNQFYVPAEAAYLPSSVSKKDLSIANSLFFFTMQGSLILGYGFAGILNNFLGFKTTLILCSALLFLAFVSVVFLPELKILKAVKFNLEKTIVRFFKGIAVGYKFIHGHRLILTPFLLLLCLQIVSTVVIINAPAIALKLIGIDVNSAGVGIVVPVAIGTIGSAFIISKMMHKKDIRKKSIIERSFLVIFLSLLILALTPPGFRKIARILFCIPLITIAGAAFVAVIIPAQTYLQEVTPGGLRGRVFGNYGFLVTVLTIIPIIFSGALVELLGIRTLLFTLSLLALTVYIISKRSGDRFLLG